MHHWCREQNIITLLTETWQIRQQDFLDLLIQCAFQNLFLHVVPLWPLQAKADLVLKIFQSISEFWIYKKEVFIALCENSFGKMFNPKANSRSASNHFAAWNHLHALGHKTDNNTLQKDTNFWNIKWTIEGHPLLVAYRVQKGWHFLEAIQEVSITLFPQQ